MSINSIISSAYTGLSASQAALKTISNNIANVNTPGYGREAVSLEALVANGGGFGVKVGSVERIADQFLTGAAYSAVADVGRYDAVSQFHDRLQGLLGAPDSDSGLAAQLNGIFSTIADLTADPADAVRRQSVTNGIDRFLGQIGQLAGDIQQLRADASNQIGESVRSINQGISRVAEINNQIVKARSLNSETAGLEQQRADALNQIAELVDIKTIEQPDGSVQVSTARGVILLDHNPRELSYPTTSAASAETQFDGIHILRVNPVSNSKTDSGLVLDPDIGSGKLRGLLDLRDQQLPNIADSLGELARAFRDSVNAVHNANATLPAPALLSGRNTGLSGTDRAGFTGAATFAVVDASGAVVAKTAVDFSALPATATLNDVITAVNAGLGGAGALSLSGGALKFQAAGAGNGVVIADNPGAPTGRGGQGFSQFFGLNDLISAGQPSSYATGLQAADPHGFAAGGATTFEVRDASNRLITSYTLNVAAGGTVGDILNTLNAGSGLGNFARFSLDASGTLSVGPAPGVGKLTTRVVDDTTNRAGTGRTLSGLFGIQPGALANAARNIGVRAEVKADPFKLALAKFDTSAAVGVQALGLGDQRGARELADLENKGLRFSAAGNIATVSATLSQYSGFVLGDAAITAKGATTAQGDATALRDDVVKRRDNYGGVNLDEELANLIVYQNSYNAAARVLTSARDIYDALLNAVN